ncbi:MAG: murein biosynthesis integral membrane protein MurJ, partial [Spirochaetes bacterium]
MNSWQEDVSSTGKIARSALSISVVTFVSRIFGLLREWTRGYLLGTTGGSDAFSLSFMFPNLLRRLVGEGAMLVAFVPVFAELKERYDEDYIREFVKSFFTLMVFILVTIVLIGYFLAPLLRFFLPEYTKIPGKIELTILLTRIMFPYIL